MPIGCWWPADWLIYTWHEGSCCDSHRSVWPGFSSAPSVRFSGHDKAINVLKYEAFLKYWKAKSKIHLNTAVSVN